MFSLLQFHITRFYTDIGQEICAFLFGEVENQRGVTDLGRAEEDPHFPCVARGEQPICLFRACSVFFRSFRYCLLRVWKTQEAQRAKVFSNETEQETQRQNPVESWSRPSATTDADEQEEKAL